MSKPATRAHPDGRTPASLRPVAAARPLAVDLALLSGAPRGTVVIVCMPGGPGALVEIDHAGSRTTASASWAASSSRRGPRIRHPAAPDLYLEGRLLLDELISSRSARSLTSTSARFGIARRGPSRVITF